MRTGRGLITIFLVAALGLAGACGADEPTRDESGAISEADDVNPNSLQPGDCFNDPDDTSTSQVTSLAAVPCDEPHDNEVFHVFDLDDGDFPGQDEVRQVGLEGCESEFEAYVGATKEEAALAIVPVTPTEQSWDSRDDRTVICAAYKADGTKLTGSVEGTGATVDDGADAEPEDGE